MSYLLLTLWLTILFATLHLYTEGPNHNCSIPHCLFDGLTPSQVDCLMCFGGGLIIALGSQILAT